MIQAWGGGAARSYKARIGRPRLPTLRQRMIPRPPGPARAAPRPAPGWQAKGAARIRLPAQRAAMMKAAHPPCVANNTCQPGPRPLACRAGQGRK